VIGKVGMGFCDTGMWVCYSLVGIWGLGFWGGRKRGLKSWWGLKF